MTGDENDYIMDYKRRNPTFPHESTLDQFYSEEQFEVYRALGFHATYNFFAGDDDFARLDVVPDDWLERVESALKKLNMPRRMRETFLSRIRPEG